jgi:hypothetical protein
MARKYTFTWQAGSSSRTGRWRKKYRGVTYYFCGGRGKTDREAYQAAVDEWNSLKKKLDEAADNPYHLGGQATCGRSSSSTNGNSSTNTAGRSNWIVPPGGAKDRPTTLAGHLTRPSIWEPARGLRHGFLSAPRPGLEAAGRREADRVVLTRKGLDGCQRGDQESGKPPVHRNLQHGFLTPERNRPLRYFAGRASAWRSRGWKSRPRRQSPRRISRP